jgi:phospho-N-acetylmuramoyl-pentapeptide-transferase
MIEGSAIGLVLAGITFILTVIWGGPLIRILRAMKAGDSIRLELPDRYLAKMGTPTMGGVMFILPTILITLLVNAVALLGNSPAGRSILLPLGTMLLFGLLGAVDDWTKLRHKEVGEGLSIRIKFLLQWLIAGVVAYGLFAFLDVPQMFVPGFKFEIELGWFYIPLAAFVIVATANAVNFTDGLDGMAGLISATAFAAFGAIAALQQQTFIVQLCFTLVGALFGYLWYNVHPAMLIMGDTGSMALGSTLGVVALMTGQWLLLGVIAIIPVSELISVAIQIVYFKLTGGKRVFRMAPLHLHFELSGWSETQVMQRFWLITLLASLIGVALAVV